MTKKKAQLDIDDAVAKARTVPLEFGSMGAAHTPIEVELAALVVDASWNIRQVADEGEQAELVESIRHNGLLQPLVVARTADPLHGGTPEAPVYRLVSGFRRHDALRTLEWTHAPAVVFNDATEAELLIANLVENEQRANVKPWEVSERYYQLQQPPYSLKGKEIAKRVGKSPAYVNNMARLRRALAPELWVKFKSAEAGERITTTQWIELAGQAPEVQHERYERIVKGLDKVAAVAEKEARKLDAPTPANDATVAGDEGEEAARGKREERSGRPGETELRAMLERVLGSRKKPDWKKGAAEVLHWVLGDGAEPVGGGRARGGE